MSACLSGHRPGGLLTLIQSPFKASILKQRSQDSTDKHEPHHEGYASKDLPYLSQVKTGFKAGREKAKNNNISNNKKASESNSGGEYNAYAMIGVVALSAVFLSNDLYAYGTASKYGFNPSFGFRKKFNNSAIEYGATYYNEDSKASKVLDFNFNFIHHIYKKQVPNSITPYIGLTTNTDLEDFGVGILFGGKIKLVERLNLDSRFEYTNTLGSRFHIGLIFTFQKEYFWKKKK